MKDYTKKKELSVNVGDYFASYEYAHDDAGDEYPMTIEAIMADFEQDAMEAGDNLGDTPEEIRDTLESVRIYMDALLEAWRVNHEEAEV